MKITDINQSEDDLYYITSYRINKLRTQADIIEVLKEFLPSDTVEFNSIYVHYLSEGGKGLEPVELHSFEEFLQILPSLQWDELDDITIMGKKSGEGFNARVGLPYPEDKCDSGVFTYYAYKKKESVEEKSKE